MPHVSPSPYALTAIPFLRHLSFVNVALSGGLVSPRTDNIRRERYMFRGETTGSNEQPRGLLSQQIIPRMRLFKRRCPH